MKERMETLEEKIARVVQEEVAVVPYNPRWPEAFERERRHLLVCLPPGLLRRIEHFGSTAVPGLPAKPIVDILIEVTSLDETRRKIAPILEAQGYDYFWRPTWGNDTPPYYAWFIKRDQAGNRTHHIHMVEAHFEHWDRLLFRDYLIDHPEVAREYGDLKMQLAGIYPVDRVTYTQAKHAFIRAVTEKAKQHYGRTPVPLVSDAITIRKARASDAESIHRTHSQAIRDLCSAAYTPSQIRAWSENLAPEHYLHGMEHFEFQVAAGEDGDVCGFVIFNPQAGEVYALYLAPATVNKGLGRRFMDLAENAIRERGHTRMQLKATLNAVPFYEHLGFQRGAASIHALSNGEPLPCMEMTKPLD